MSETNPKFKVTIDGVEVEVDPGTTILNAANSLLAKLPSGKSHRGRSPAIGL